MLHIDTLRGHERMSTQELLLEIEAAVAGGESDFDIAASGQHDIGGPLWHPEGKKLTFHVTNPGQRVGSMCLDNTEVIVDGPASADVGWLNAGGIITVRGDAGDTAGHCSAGGKIYIGGRAGTRTGSLMKHDPLYEEPELWVLKNVGSFSFEFMGGGRAVVCGVDCDDFASVLGERACVGMVGGIVYVRGAIDDCPDDIRCLALDDDDRAFIAGGIDDFLAAIERPELKDEITKDNFADWRKLRPLTFEEKKPKEQPNITDFRQREWVRGGIFSDVADDDFAVVSMLNHGLYRLRVPSWDNGKYASPCEFACPTGVPTQRRYDLLREGKINEALRLVLDYTPFPGSVCGMLCPNPCMEGCTRGDIDEAVQINALGLASIAASVEPPAERTDKKIAVIGGGVAGLSAAWQLARRGHSVTVYDDAEHIGGKLWQVIPEARMPRDILAAELGRIERMGVKFVTGCRVNRERFDAIVDESDAVIVATGGHRSRARDWEGKEYLTMSLDYLKAINLKQHPATGKNVIVLGGGNSAMDVAMGAFGEGAESVTIVSHSKPKAFEHEMRRVEERGGKIVWPFETKKITANGIYSEEEKFIAGDQVIVAVGEQPILDYLPNDESINKYRDAWLVPDETHRILPKVFAAGDVVKPAQLTDAIGDGARTARAVDEFVRGEKITPQKVRPVIPKERLSTAYFEKCRHCDIPNAQGDVARCVSCGTCRDCHMCVSSCPERAIARNDLGDGAWEYVSDPKKCIGCGLCASICPCGVWSIRDNPEPIKMYRTYEKSA